MSRAATLTALARLGRIADRTGFVGTAEEFADLGGLRLSDDADAVAPGESLLRAEVGELRQRLGRPEADADGESQPLRHPAPDFRAERLRFGQKIEAREVEKRLVYRIHLDARREAPENLDDPVGEVGVESVIAGQRSNPRSLRLRPDLEPRRAHRYAESLRLRAARHDAPVVISE